MTDNNNGPIISNRFVSNPTSAKDIICNVGKCHYCHRTGRPRGRPRKRDPGINPSNWRPDNENGQDLPNNVMNIVVAKNQPGIRIAVPYQHSYYIHIAEVSALDCFGVGSSVSDSPPACRANNCTFKVHGSTVSLLDLKASI